jgi:co-chaperonin GroES (HSP10)
MTLQAVGDQVIVRQFYHEKEGSIYIPDTAKKYNAAFYGEVISVGPESKEDIKVGDKIAWTRHEGFEIEHDGIVYLALRPRHIQGVYDDPTNEG